MLQKYLTEPKPNDVDNRKLVPSLSEQEDCEPAECLLIMKIAALSVLDSAAILQPWAEVPFNKICQCKHTLGMEGSGISKSPEVQFQGKCSKNSFLVLKYLHKTQVS